MDIDKVKKIFALFVAAFGLFVLIFIIYSIFIISRIAQENKKHEIKKDYAGEPVSPSLIPSPTVSKQF